MEGGFVLRLIAVIASASALSPTIARAGNDDEVTIGNQAALAAGAVTATGSDGAAAWYNPAAIAAVTEDTVDVSGSAFSLRHYRMHGFLSASTGDSVTASTTELVSIPSALTLVRPISDDVRIGIGLFVPRTSDVSVRETLYTTGVTSTWILDLASSSQSYHAGATIAVRAHERVRVGFSLGAVYNTQSARAELFGGLQAEDGTTGVFGTTIDASVWTVGVEAAAGVQIDPSDALTIGLSVRSPSLDLYSRAALEQVSTSAVAGGMATPAIDLSPSEVIEEGMHAASLAPPRVRGAIAIRLPTGWIALEADVQPGWRDEEFQTSREPVWNARIGGIFRVADGVSLGAGFFTDHAADPDPTDITDTHVDFYGGTIGLTLDNVHRLAEGEDADDIVFSSTVGLRYAYGTGELAGMFVNFDPAAGELIEPRIDDVEVHEIGLHVGSALFF